MRRPAGWLWLLASVATALLVLSACQGSPGGSATGQRSARSSPAGATTGSDRAPPGGTSGRPDTHAGPTGHPATPPTRREAAPRPDPTTVVRQYFDAINERDYQRAWDLGGRHLDSSFPHFAAGFANTLHDDATIRPSGPTTASVDLVAHQREGPAQHFRGVYTVRDGVIVAAQVSEVNGGGGDRCGAPPNPYGDNFCGNGTRIYRPAPDFCDYFACIPNFSAGTGYVEQCRDGRFSLSGGVEGACSQHGGERRPLNGGR